jgi:predicted nucleic acid-binding protein
MAPPGDSLPSGVRSARTETRPRSEASPHFDDELRAATLSLRDALRQAHLLRSVEQIRGANEDGIFPPASLHDVPPVVVDANVICKDVVYACKNAPGMTTLVNAANAGFLRLFCASHVVDEVAEHFEDWSSQFGVEARDFEATWRTQYLPLLHLVAIVPAELLTTDESLRIDALARKDPDDVPSATLALLIEGFYLSEDGPATTAVYGEARTQNELKKWRGVLAAGSNVSAISAVLEAVALVAELARTGIRDLGAVLGRAPTWMLGIAIGAGAAVTILTARSADPSRGRRIRSSLMHLLKFLAAARVAYQADLSEFKNACAPQPTPQVLVRDLTGIQLLSRAALWELARSRHCRQSAAEIARALPVLPVAQSEGRVRDALRAQAAARQIQRGRWQLGEPVTWPPHDSTFGL